MATLLYRRRTRDNRYQKLREQHQMRPVPSLSSLEREMLQEKLEGHRVYMSLSGLSVEERQRTQVEINKLERKLGSSSVMKG